MFPGLPPGYPCDFLTVLPRDAKNISALSEGISMKLGISDRHVSGHSCKGFHGHRSKVKVKCTFAAEAYISTAWSRDSLVRFRFTEYYTY